MAFLQVFFHSEVLGKQVQANVILPQRSRGMIGMKSIDDALEIRARVVGAFERAELAKDPAQGILATGHSSIIQVPVTDDWYIAYHRFALG